VIYGITKEQEHNAHVDEEREGFVACHQVVVHCETPEEARAVAETVSSEHEIEGGDQA